MSTNHAIFRNLSLICVFLNVRASPVGIASLVCVAVLEMDDPESTFKSISFYMLTVLVGLAIQGKLYSIFFQ